MKQPGRNIAVGIYILGVLFIFECLLRFIFPIPEVKSFNRSMFIPLPDNVPPANPMCKENKTYMSYPDTMYQFVHTLNEYGFRDGSWPLKKNPHKSRIIFIGDSFLEGTMAEDNESIPSVFEQLAENDALEVFNAGILGAGLPEYASLLYKAIPIFKPDYIFLVLFSNDISGRPVNIPKTGYMPEKNNFFAPRLYVLIRALVSGKPLTYRGKRATPFIPPTPNPANLWSSQEEEFKKHVTPEFAEYMKRGQYNFWRINYLAAEENHLKKRVDLRAYFNWLRTYANDHKCKILVSYLPSRSQVTNFYYKYEQPSCVKLCHDSIDLRQVQYNIHQDQLSEIFSEMNIPFHDLTPGITHEESKGKHLYWNYDDHMKARGYKYVAESLYAFWKRQE